MFMYKTLGFIKTLGFNSYVLLLSREWNVANSSVANPRLASFTFEPYTKRSL